MPVPSERTSPRAVITAPPGPREADGASRGSQPPREAHGALTVAVAAALRSLRERPGPLPAPLLDAMTNRLRWAAGADPSGGPARASVLVACALLSSGDLEEGFLALEESAGFLAGRAVGWTSGL